MCGSVGHSDQPRVGLTSQVPGTGVWRLAEPQGGAVGGPHRPAPPIPLLQGAYTFIPVPSRLCTALGGTREGTAIEGLVGQALGALAPFLIVLAPSIGCKDPGGPGGRGLSGMGSDWETLSICLPLSAQAYIWGKIGA